MQTFLYDNNEDIFLFINLLLIISSKKNIIILTSNKLSSKQLNG